MNLRFKWQEFISFGQQMELPKKTIIFQQGEEGKGFYYIDKGQIKITLLSDQGTERTIHYLAEGSLFGEQAYNGRPYLTTAIVTKPSVIYFFNQAAFQQICKHEPQAIHIFMHSCIAKVRLLGEMTAILNSSLEKHLAYTIVNLYKIQGGSSITLDQTAH